VTPDIGCVGQGRSSSSGGNLPPEAGGTRL
jgi:hypothetical protein